MTTFLLIRHAATDTIDSVLAGWMPVVHLNQAGRVQAERLAERLEHVPVAALSSSPLERARETAAPIAQRLRLRVQICDSLGEMHFGAWTGQEFQALASARQWQQFNSFRSGTRAPGGEMMLEVQTRIVAALERLRAQYTHGVVVAVSHGDVIKAALGYYAGIPLDLLQRLVISPASVSILAVNDDGPQILRLNDTGELPHLGS